MQSLTMHPIGIVHTPYVDMAPVRPDENIEGEFYLDVDPKYQTALQNLDEFSHIIVLFYFDRTKKVHLTAHPPNFPGKEVGVFASRSPFRPNHIGMDIVKLLRIKENRIYTSHLDILDNTPLLDIKPYVPDIDLKADASNGWIYPVKF